jgi:hypothetical protein
MIAARAVRRFRLAGKEYPKGAPIRLAENQYADLASIGLVERSPAPTQAVIAKVSTATRRPVKRRPAPKRTD